LLSSASVSPGGKEEEIPLLRLFCYSVDAAAVAAPITFIL
jgi:hypothetical protein